MKKTTSSSLKINRETVRALSPRQLGRIGGGGSQFPEFNCEEWDDIIARFPRKTIGETL